ncbi:MAG TPA: ATP-dependent 6-phosphofructokinase [Bdellovibrionales bacterium]|nr:ATP-dependent 6-phosphofructokinase [Bdellovibrionales bacterium]
MAAQRIGILTGGGDAPGLNGIIEAVVRSLSRQGVEVVGICDGFEGIFNRRTVVLDPARVSGAHCEAGTILGTSNKSGIAGREEEFRQCFASLGLDGLIAAGGDGTFAGLQKVVNGLKLIGVPKTIDNDLEGTEFTFGYDTACAVVAEAADALRATAEAHRRVMIVETMGRTAGWIALGGGLASYADVILLPERPFSRAKLAEFIRSKKADGRRGLIIVASEGAIAEKEEASIAFRVEGSPQAERFGGFSERLARWVEKECDWETRHVVLGHLQRSRPPTTTDRFLTLAMGVEVSRMVADSDWGKAVVYREGRIKRAPISDLMKPPKLVAPDHRFVQLAQALGIFI